MKNKKLEITLSGKKHQLWFNNYATFEIMKMYGIGQDEVLKKVMKKANDNYLLLLVDLITIGLKGHSFAKGETSPDIIDKLPLILADSDMAELLEVWEVFFDVMGGNVPEVKEKQPKGVKGVKKKVAKKKS